MTEADTGNQASIDTKKVSATIPEAHFEPLFFWMDPMKKYLLVAALALSAYSTSAMAGEGFLRLELGASDVELTDYYDKASDDSVSGILSGGYWFTPNIAIEAHAGSLYNTDLGYDEELDLVSIGIGLAGKMYVTGGDKGFFVGARAGIARLTGQVREDTFYVSESESTSSTYYGVNAGYDFNRRWGLQVSYDLRSADFDHADVDTKTLTVGGEWRF